MKHKVPFSKKRGSALGSVLGGCMGVGAKLTPAETDVLYLLSNEFLTVKQASIRRKCTPRAIRKIRQKLKDKGVFGMVPHMVPKIGGPSSPAELFSEKIRLHAEHFSINILWCDDRYRSKVKGGSFQFMDDGNTVICYRNKLEVYSNKDFWGYDPNAAKVKSLHYWAKFFTRLESKVNCNLIKDGSQNVTLIRAEYAEVGNELAKTALVEHEKVRVVGDDGKVWLLIDNSFNFKELEAVHRFKSKDDMQNVVQPFFNDLRAAKGDILLPRQADKMIFENTAAIAGAAAVLKENMRNWDYYSENMVSHVKAVQKLGFCVDSLIIEIKKMNELNKRG